MLSASQKRNFTEQGFLVLPDFKSMAECAALKVRAGEIAAAHDVKTSRDMFSTNHQKGPQADKTQEYFLGSANEIRCFFEENAFDDAGDLRYSLTRSMNKIGHAMHDLDSVFDGFSRGEKLANLASDLGMSETKIWQSMYIFKQPRIGGEVGWHQDTGFFMTTPQSVTTFWFAIDDATLENGCLWVQPGGHKTPLRQKFTRDGMHTKITDLDEMPWPPQDEAVPVEVRAGTLVCFNGMLPHYSPPNTSSSPRHAYTLHVTNASAAYAPDNWIQRGVDFPAKGF